ncbi:MAG TPA: hypothetical protein DCE56_06135 [Cyanobacteria bacterium UBA8553]|nr:hypothetical protein [Cyanobacteria bacterium UBA8553]HAJ61720.1 hypothetical protein [Cyanobacteria bacterium UBA8543]
MSQWLFIGIALGVVFVTLVRTQKTAEPTPYATGLLVAALIYLVFGLTNGATVNWLITETLGVGIYGIFALLGLRYSFWWIAIGWAIHPAWDVGFHLLGQAKTFVPMWYVVICISFDFVVAISILEEMNQDYSMNLSKRPQQVLLAIVAVNFISTWLHYTDNALFLNQYPGPEWFTPIGILATVIVMTPIGLLGYWLYIRRSFWLSYLVLGVYSITSVSSPGHYLFPMVAPMSFKMHSLIWLDAVSGLSLIGFLVWSCAVVQEWRSTEIVD